MLPPGQAPRGRGRQRPPPPDCLIPCHPVSLPGRKGPAPTTSFTQRPARKRPSPGQERALTCANTAKFRVHPQVKRGQPTRRRSVRTARPACPGRSPLTWAQAPPGFPPVSPGTVRLTASWSQSRSRAQGPNPANARSIRLTGYSRAAEGLMGLAVGAQVPDRSARRYGRQQCGPRCSQTRQSARPRPARRRSGMPRPASRSADVAGAMRLRGGPGRGKCHVLAAFMKIRTGSRRAKIWQCGGCGVVAAGRWRVRCCRRGSAGWWGRSRRRCHLRSWWRSARSSTRSA